MKILITGGGTGGHVYPALALAEGLRAQDPRVDVAFVGSLDRLESRLVPEAGWPYHSLPVLSVPRRLNAAFFRALLALWRSYRQALRLLEPKPAAVVGVGGYIAFPLVVAAIRRGVPVFLLEQNAQAGLANRLLAPWARRVMTSFAETPLPNAVHVGNPLRAEIRSPLDRSEAKSRLGLSERPLLLVTGGSLGARALNDALLAVLPSVLEAGWQVVHVAGDKDHARMAPLAPLDPNYRLMSYCNQMPVLMAAADLALARAGATSVAELAACEVPALLVPYPHAGGHQRPNAWAAQRAGAAEVLEEADLDRLWEHLVPLLSAERRQRMQEGCRRLGRPNAAEEAAKLLLECVAGSIPVAHQGR